jgi:phenylacetate-CoA ligase
MMPSTLMYRALEIFNDFCERAEATTLPCPPPSPYDSSLQIAQMFKANTIIGFPSRLIDFARFIKKNDLRLEIDNVIFAGEPFVEQRRSYLQEVLNARRFSGIFGSAESGIWGFQPHDIKGDCYLFPEELMHVELANVDEQGFGNLILTNLVRGRNPLLRYDSGDTGRLSCIEYGGSKLRMLELRGRARHSFDIGGDYFSLSDYADLFARFLESQIRLSYEEEQKMDKIAILLVPRTMLARDEQEQIVKEVREITNSNDALFVTEVQFVEMDVLQRGATSQKIVKIVDTRSAIPYGTAR